MQTRRWELGCLHRLVAIVYSGCFDAIFQLLGFVQSEARENDMTYEQRYNLRKNKSAPILLAFKKWLDHYHPKTSEQGKIAKAGAIFYSLIQTCKANNVEPYQYFFMWRLYE